jgi:hypothetical protein
MPADGSPADDALAESAPAENGLTGDAPAADDLSAYAVPAQPAPAGPLVAEQIDLDPSIRQTPSLPPHRPGIDDDTPLPQPSHAPLPLPVDEPQLPTPQTAGWTYPRALVEQLQALVAADPRAAGPVEETLSQIDTLVKLPAIDDPAAEPCLQRLRALALQIRDTSLQFSDEDARSRWLRAGYSIARRQTIWNAGHELESRRDVPLAPHPNAQQWEATLRAVEAHLNATPVALPWRQYLLIAKAREMLGSQVHPAEEQRALAREILHRMQSAHLSQSQADFIAGGPFDAFSEQLRAFADEPREYGRLFAAVEAYEAGELTAQSTALADIYEELRWSPDPAVNRLADIVNEYYRNANVRVAISAQLVNRMLPNQTYMAEPVKDMIQGAQVYGTSQTSARLRLVLLPDRRRWRLGLEAHGAVASTTASSKGPATFYQDGLSHYRARKLLTVDRRGIRLFNAEGEANANSQLQDYETDFDGIPLLGSIARAIARKEYDEQSHAAQSEVEGKIANRASSTLDYEVAARIEKTKSDFQQKLLTPLQELKLEPTAVDMETTAERLIARYRLAGKDQLSAHTPRPQAPNDSLLSVQVHETALNNAINRLGLQGRRIELRELYKELTTRFSQSPPPVPDDLPEGVFVTFAQEDPVRVDCEDGRVRLTIRLEELASDNNAWKNFTVRGYYVPDADQLDANLVRDGVIELAADRRRLGIGDQVALRTIFSRVMSKNRKISLLNETLAKSPNLRDQQVTQFVIHDGWIGVALGPHLPNRNTAMTPIPDGRHRK